MKKLTSWTRKHNKYSVQNRLTPTARELWQWLLDEMPEGSHEIIDLRDFNKWVKKTRGFPHDPKTVKSAAQQLRDKGVLTNAKSYTAYVWKWTLQPIYVLIPPPFRPPQKKSVSQLQIPGLDPSIGVSDENQDITTTTFLGDSESNSQDRASEEFQQKLEACRTAGIYYLPKDATFLCNFTLQKVLKAILYFLSNRESIYKPEGWFRVCLEDNWADLDEERQQLHSQWYSGGLLEAVRHCTKKIEGFQASG